jgi:hypothetical protein
MGARPMSVATPPPPSGPSDGPDFFASEWGLARQYKARYPRTARLLDRAYDARLASSQPLARIRREAAQRPALDILIVGVESPNRPGEMARVANALTSSRHRTTISVVPMADRGKFANVDAAIVAAPAPLDRFDWLVIADDDIGFAPGLLDDFIATAEAADLAVAQPAHRFDSYCNYRLTHRRWGSLVRRTGFVEIGPLTALRADTFADLIPFPASRWCYGIDVYWASLAQARGWKMGVVDATPISHMRPVATAYDSARAVAEGREMLARLGVAIDRTSVLGPGKVAIGW